MKKILLITSALCFGSELMAAGEESNTFAGGQIGARVGMSSFSASHKDLFVQVTGGSTYDSYNEWKTNENDVNAGAFLKYTVQKGRVLAGIEAHGYWHNINEQDKYFLDADVAANVAKGVTQLRKIKSNYVFGLGANIGTEFSGAHVYAKLGGVVSKFKINGSFIDQTGDSFSAATALNEFDTLNKTVFGFAPGIGMEAALTERLRISLEATHEIYSKINGNQAARKVKKADNTDLADTYELKDRIIRPKNTRVTIGIGYKLGR